MNAFLRDFHYSARQLRKNPGFAATAVMTLVLAIGVTAAVFSVLYATLIRPLPYAQPDKIFYLQAYSPQGYQQPASYPEYLDWRRENHVFSALAGWSSGRINFEGPAGPEALPSVATTDNFFDVFGVNPILGRTFAPGEDQPGKNDVAVLSYEIWRQDFGGQKDAIGKTVKLDGRPYTVIGVMPAGFRYPVSMRNAVYTPLNIPKELAETRHSHWLPAVGRLKDGVSRAQAQADMDTVLNNIGNAYPDISKGRRMKLESLATHVVGNSASPLKVLTFAVLAVLLIGCVNIAGLLLARGVKREREVALRTAIGANRWRIARQMLTETLVIAVLGALGGTLLAYLLLDAIRKLLIGALAQGADVRLNIPVLLVSLALAVLTSLLAGLAPALRLSGIAPSLALKAGGSAGSSRSQHRLRGMFIVTQVALAMVLLVTSGLLMRVLAGLRSTDLGFNPNHLIATEINLSQGTYHGRNVVTDLYNPLLERVQAIPGVTAAGVIQRLPIKSWGSNSDVQIVGHPPAPPNEEQLAEYRLVSPGYFPALGVALARGRLFDPAIDTPTSQQVAVVNEAFVKKFFAKGEDPVGKYIANDPNILIVGVVKNVRQDIYQPPLAEMDFPISQAPAAQSMDFLGHMELVVRTSVDPASVTSSLRQAFHAVDPGLPFETPETMHQVLSDVLIFERLESWLFGTFAALAMLLAIVGLYGLISHEVELSTRDIGVRLALGATRGNVLGTVYRRVGMMLAGGVVLGLAATMAVQKLIASVVQIHAEKDAMTIAGLVVLLIVAGLLAALLPARRAATVEPVKALRYE